MSRIFNVSSESRRKTPWDDIVQKTPTQAFLFKAYNDAYKSRHPDLSETDEDILINSFVPTTCPYHNCGSSHIIKVGKSANHIDRYKCQDCGRKFSPVTNTIFDGHKIAISQWVDFWLNLSLMYISLNESTSGSFLLNF